MCIRNFIQLTFKITLHILNLKCLIRKNKFMSSPKNLGAKPQPIPALLL